MSATAQRVTHDEGDQGAFGVRGLSKSFGALQVIDSLSLDFESGRITALLGPNGAGKTTLLKCLIGLVHPDAGSVFVSHSVVNGSGKYRHDIGYMPQLPHFPAQLSGWELASMLDDLRRFGGEPDEELVDAFEIRQDMNKPFRTLSGGTRQKVNAALAFRYGAPVMILDEPTAGLDPVAAMALKDKVRARRDAGCTVLISSHNLGELEALAESVVFLLDGRARFDGTLEGLLLETGRGTLEEAIAHLMLQRGSTSPDVLLRTRECSDRSLRLGVA